jgi:hypothetical protein
MELTDENPTDVNADHDYTFSIRRLRARARARLPSSLHLTLGPVAAKAQCKDLIARAEPADASPLSEQCSLCSHIVRLSMRYPDIKFGNDFRGLCSGERLVAELARFRR